MDMLKLAVICGGPSQERGISLNSARSVIDHLKSSSVDLISLYVDSQKQFHRISPFQLYSNTPSDFDFKLHDAADKLNPSDLKSIFKSVDLVFPLIHGSFGEDGELQALLERYQVPFVGSSSETCRWMFHKHQAAETLRGYGFATLPQVLLSREQHNPLQVIEHFFHSHSLKRAIVKPTIGGSSIGVYSVSSPQEAYARMHDVFSHGTNSQALLEPFCEGKEFTVVVFENVKGEPVALIPTELDLSYDDNQIFDYRKKYLPTNQVTYHTPPRFPLDIVQQICMQAEQIFKLFGMRDFVRLDGWLMKDGTIYFTDVNPLSGLEQNSFFFRQASLLGLTHREALEYILKNACQRYGIDFSTEDRKIVNRSKIPIYVLFGNQNAERQVSLMSGTNVWLKLLHSSQHAPIPFLFDHQGSIWELPYSYTLNHTVEEIYTNCLNRNEEKEAWQQLIEAIRLKLSTDSKSSSIPNQMLLKQFIERAQRQQAFVFIAMHGGEGENGTLQRYLEEHQIPFNGSNSQTSALCMDKYLTGQAIESLNDPDIQTVPKKNILLTEFEKCSSSDFESLWTNFCRELESSRLIIKPRFDGCSAGIILLESAHDLEHYCRFVFQKASYIPPYSFANQHCPVEMPSTFGGEYLMERYIETDMIFIEHNQLHDHPKEGWIELTVGIFEYQGKYQAMSPSITVAEGTILSLEEKFQGGTGINLTPPPHTILSLSAIQKIKRLVETAAQALGIQNYARLDIFFNRFSEKMFLIEANTLPALTPSTVIYHQGLAEEPPLSPLGLLDKIISSKLNSYR